MASLGGPGLGYPSSLDLLEVTLFSTSTPLAGLPTTWNALPTLESGPSTRRPAR